MALFPVLGMDASDVQKQAKMKANDKKAVRILYAEVPHGFLLVFVR